MKKTKFLTIFPTFEKLKVVQKTLPSIIEETKKNNAKLIVHDSSVKNRKEKWEYLQKLNKDNDFLLILSDNISMAHARNMCLQLGQEVYAPDYICMMEDDHGFKKGLIKTIIRLMSKYYGEKSPNNLNYGLFSGCIKHFHGSNFIKIDDSNLCPAKESDPMAMGGANSCFRCAPTSHWNNVIKGYDTDEYLISTYQTKNLNFRNYNKGFTTMFIGGGKYVFDIDDIIGRGASQKDGLKLWDEKYTASDERSVFVGKDKKTIVNRKMNLLQKIQNKIKN